jgi:hypothetical protein
LLFVLATRSEWERDEVVRHLANRCDAAAGIASLGASRQQGKVMDQLDRENFELIAKMVRVQAVDMEEKLREAHLMESPEAFYWRRAADFLDDYIKRMG